MRSSPTCLSSSTTATPSSEMKVGGLALFGYAFFKFGWSYRLFNYCTILFGGIPMVHDTEKDIIAAERAAERVIRMNVIAGSHFNEGLRAIFLSIRLSRLVH